VCAALTIPAFVIDSLARGHTGRARRQGVSSGLLDCLERTRDPGWPRPGSQGAVRDHDLEPSSPRPTTESADRVAPESGPVVRTAALRPDAGHDPGLPGCFKASGRSGCSPSRLRRDDVHQLLAHTLLAVVSPRCFPPATHPAPAAPQEPLTAIALRPRPSPGPGRSSNAPPRSAVGCAAICSEVGIRSGPVTSNTCSTRSV